MGRITKDYTLLNPPLGSGIQFNFINYNRSIWRGEERYTQINGYNESSKNYIKVINNEGRTREIDE